LGRLIFAMNVTLDGCCDHRAGIPDGELHRYFNALMDEADGLVFGRVVYEMMERDWPPIARAGKAPKPMLEFAKKIEAKPKYVASRTRKIFDWNNTTRLTGDVAKAVSALKKRRTLLVGSPTLGRSLAERGLIDEYRFVVHPVIAGRGPTLFDGLRRPPRLKLLDAKRFKSGVIALRYGS
jgi:dihydrofolate reductase